MRPLEPKKRRRATPRVAAGATGVPAAGSGVTSGDAPSGKEESGLSPDAPRALDPHADAPFSASATGGVKGKKMSERGSNAQSGVARWQSDHRHTHQGMSFSLRIMISFIVTALVTVIILVLVLQVELRRQFLGYTQVAPEKLSLITTHDLAESFLNGTFVAITFAAVVAVVLAWSIGIVLARSLARPITRITNTARAIRNGNLAARTGLKGTNEVGELGETFDDMAASLEADLRMEHRLTSDVAHELRTPLMSIIVNVEAMQDGVLPADTEHLELVAGEVRRLSRLVDAMLRLSRIENGTTPVNAEPTDIVGLVSTLVQSQEQLFADQGLSLRFRLDAPKGQAWATVDRDLLRQAVVNLLSNAMRYTPEGGNVVAAVGQDRDDVLISVTDTGIGIEQEDLKRVFTRFWRSDASRERDSGGLGVGLSLVREIVLRHGGFVTVESEVGRGSTFTLHIPRWHGWGAPTSTN